MSRKTKRASFVGFSVAAVVIVASSVAWACSPAARIDCAGATASEGAVGDPVMINGCSFYNDQPVEVRWDSKTGPLLGKATGPEFSLRVNVPASATVGGHMFVVVFRYSDAEGADVRRELKHAFTVTSAGVTTGQSRDPVTSGSGSGGEPADATPTAAPVSPPTGSTSAVVGESSSTTGAATAIPAAQAVPASAKPAAVRTPSGRVVFGGSTPSVASPGPAAAQPVAAVSDDEVSPQVPARTAAGDLWSGFLSGSMTDRAIGLEAGTSTGSDSSAAVAVLLGAGLLALFAGFAAAEMGRRRAVAHAGNRSHRS